jgi:hypothetical protein
MLSTARFQVWFKSCIFCRPPAVYPGVLNDVEATDKSIAAGGKDSVKNEYGVSDPYATGARKAINTKELMQKLQKIQSISLKVRHSFSYPFRFILWPHVANLSRCAPGIME